MLNELIDLLTGGKERQFQKELKEGKWIKWGLAAIPTEDVLNGRQQLGWTDPKTGITKIFTPEELGLIRKENSP